MNINTYLPDELGEQAKAASLPLSQLLRQVVIDELERRKTMTETLNEAKEIEIDFEDHNGRVITGRFVGTEISEDIYVTEDGRVIVHDPERLRYLEVDDPEHDLRDHIGDDGVYVEAMAALGFKAVIDI